MKDLTIKPTSVFLAVTLRCNSRCVMCDIWKNNNLGSLDPKICRKLPSSLKMIDITGGEPFLHPDLPGIVEVLRQTCPKARILITTNGLLTDKIAKIVPRMLSFDKNLAFRVSLDGFGKVHDEVRGIPGAFKRAFLTIEVLKRLNIKDLGIIFTLTKYNAKELEKVLIFCKKEKLQFSLNLVHNSPIYYGINHLELRPNQEVTEIALRKVGKFFLFGLSNKNLAKVWFYHKLVEYSKIGKRPIHCRAGVNFFYIDPLGNIYVCQFKNFKIGNLKEQSLNDILGEKKGKRYLEITNNCHDCFMICTTRDEVSKGKLQIIKDLLNIL